jgi:ABC-type microcin C transport system permease subunit YejB
MGIQDKADREKFSQLRQTLLRFRLGEIYQKMLKVIDQIEAMRREEMPVSGSKPSGEA